jgi:hypothetical protein
VLIIKSIRDKSRIPTLLDRKRKNKQITCEPKMNLRPSTSCEGLDHSYSHIKRAFKSDPREISLAFSYLWKMYLPKRYGQLCTRLALSIVGFVQGPQSLRYRIHLTAYYLFCKRFVACRRQLVHNIRSAVSC